MGEGIKISEGYMRTKVGIIPDNWHIKEFSEVVSVDEESLSTNTDKGYSFSYVSLSDINNHGQIINTSTEVFASAPSRARRIVKKGDILMSTVRPNLQGFALIRDDVKDLIASTGFAVLTSKKCNREFLYHYLFSDLISRQLYQLIAGSNYPAINSSDVKKLKLPYPPLAEQQKIAKILSTCDSAIQICEKTIKTLRKRNKGLAQQLLTGKIRLSRINGDWSSFRVSDLFQLVNRHIEWNENCHYDLISIRRRHGGIFFRGSFHANEIKVKKLKEIKEGDFLISKRQVSHGAWAVVPNEYDSFLVSDEYDCLSIKDKSVLNSAFWKWYCKQPKMTNYAFLDSIGVHIEKLIFHFKQFKKRQVQIPGLREQQAITSVLEEADKELKLYEKKLSALKEQKKGLMQKLLTGEIRVKTDN